MQEAQYAESIAAYRLEIKQETSKLLRHMQGRNAAYEMLAVALEALGYHPDELYQTCPELGNKTVQRIRSCMDVEPSDLVVHMSLSSLQEIKKQEHVDNQAAARAAQLPEHFEGVRAACLKVGVRLSLALSSVIQYRNPLEAVQRRLEDMAKLSKHAVIHKPAAFFVHLMRNNKEVVLPLTLQDPGEVPKAAPKPAEGKLEVGQLVRLFGAVCQIIRVGVSRSDVLHPEGYEFGEMNERLHVCRRLAQANTP